MQIKRAKQQLRSFYLDPNILIKRIEVHQQGAIDVHLNPCNRQRPVKNAENTEVKLLTSKIRPDVGIIQ